MKASQLVQVLSVALKNGWATLLQGAPGVGKSDIVASVGKALGFDLMICHPVVDDPTDAKGLPAIVNGNADFLPYGNLRAMIETQTPLIVFLDDLGQASQSVQAAYMQLLLAREINGKKISPHVRFIAATNRRTDNAGVAGLITPLISRFHATLDLEIDAGDWSKWAISNGVPLELVAFINFRPAMLSTFDPKTAKNGAPFATPRTVAMLGNWLAAGVTDPAVFAGCVGESFATEFAAFLAIYSKVGTLPAQVILNPQATPIPQELDVRFALMAALTYHAKPANIDAIGQYVSRVDPEFETFFWKIATGRKQELQSTNAFTRWTIAQQSQIN